MVLNKVGKPAIYLPSVMIVWGVISGATAGIHSFGGLVAIRFFLGFVEAAYFVSFLPDSILARLTFVAWRSVLSFIMVRSELVSSPCLVINELPRYTRKELALRTAMMYSGSLISGAFSGLITAGITNGLTFARGLRAWSVNVFSYLGQC